MRGHTNIISISCSNDVNEPFNVPTLREHTGVEDHEVEQLLGQLLLPNGDKNMDEEQVRCTLSVDTLSLHVRSRCCHINRTVIWWCALQCS